MTIQREFRTEKVIRKKGNKLYVRWKEYDNSFDSCLYIKTISSYKMTYYTRPDSYGSTK